MVFEIFYYFWLSFFVSFFCGSILIYLIIKFWEQHVLYYLNPVTQKHENDKILHMWKVYKKHKERKFINLFGLIMPKYENSFSWKNIIENDRNQIK